MAIDANGLAAVDPLTQGGTHTVDGHPAGGDPVFHLTTGTDTGAGQDLL